MYCQVTKYLAQQKSPVVSFQTRINQICQHGKFPFTFTLNEERGYVRYKSRYMRMRNCAMNNMNSPS